MSGASPGVGVGEEQVDEILGGDFGPGQDAAYPGVGGRQPGNRAARVAGRQHQAADKVRASQGQVLGDDAAQGPAG